jgi:hypothetical protein
MSEAAGVVGRGLGVGEGEVEHGRRVAPATEPAVQRQWVDGNGFLLLFVGIQLTWLAVIGYGVFLVVAGAW